MVFLIVTTIPRAGSPDLKMNNLVPVHPSGGLVKPDQKRRNTMSRYEYQIQETERRFDERIREIELQDPNVLSSAVSGSRLHQIIHNPVTEGIAEG